MSRVCIVCNKGQNSGNNVSHSHRKTRRTFKANVQKVKIVKEGKVETAYVCARCLKSDKVEKTNPCRKCGGGFCLLKKAARRPAACAGRASGPGLFLCRVQFPRFQIRGKVP